MAVDGTTMGVDPIRNKYGGSSINNAVVPTRSSLEGSPVKAQSVVATT